jgi:hypothetical protein
LAKPPRIFVVRAPLADPAIELHRPDDDAAAAATLTLSRVRTLTDCLFLLLLLLLIILRRPRRAPRLG